MIGIEWRDEAEYFCWTASLTFARPGFYIPHRLLVESAAGKMHFAFFDRFLQISLKI
jgi:hypothetical protein